jgi:hypothetical protein
VGPNTPDQHEGLTIRCDIVVVTDQMLLLLVIVIGWRLAPPRPLVLLRSQNIAVICDPRLATRAGFADTA